MVRTRSVREREDVGEWPDDVTTHAESVTNGAVGSVPRPPGFDSRHAVAKSPTPRGHRARLSMERATGVEPASSAWKAEVLPMNYARIWSGRQDSNLRHPAPKAGALPNCATSRRPEPVVYGQTPAGATLSRDARMLPPLQPDPVLVGDSANHPTRRAHGKMPGGHVARDDAPRTDHAAAADGHTRHDLDIASEPAIVLDGDG